MNFIEELKGSSGLEVSVSEEDLLSHSHDASVFEVKPQAVVYPRDGSEVKKLVQKVIQGKQRESGLSLTARSAGTDMGGGPLNDSIIVDFTKHFTRIGAIKNDSASVQPGVYYRDFEKATLAEGLLMPSYTASREICTVGGMVANNSGGEKSLFYGKTERYIEELRVVLSDGEEYAFRALTGQELEGKKKLQTFEGEVYRKMDELLRTNYDLIKNAKPTVSKNSAGYFLWNVWDKENDTFDLTKLLVGSQGTLGLVTEITFKLVKPRPYSELLVIFLDDLKPLGDLVHAVLRFNPESFESYDDHTFKLAIRFLPDILKRMKSGALLLGLRFLPELIMTLTGGVPKLILIAEFAGTKEEHVLGCLRQAQKEVEEKFKVRTHITKSREEAKKYWIMRRESFNLLRQHVKGKHTAPFIDDIVVHPKDLPEFLPKLNKILDKYPSLIYTIAGHAGDANFHIIPLMDLKRPEDRAIIPKLSEEVYALVKEYHGSITAEHNDGLIRTPYLKQMYGEEVYRLFEETKKIFDPLNIFNPRKKVGGDLAYMTEHIKKN